MTHKDDLPKPKYKIGDYVDFKMVSGQWTKRAFKIVDVKWQKNPYEYEVYYTLEDFNMSINETILRRVTWKKKIITIFAQNVVVILSIPQRIIKFFASVGG